MAVGIQENTFREYTEDWEKARVIINEATYSTARYTLAIKYKRMAMWNEE
jgi:hypothetical protein